MEQNDLTHCQKKQANDKQKRYLIDELDNSQLLLPKLLLGLFHCPTLSHQLTISIRLSSQHQESNFQLPTEIPQCFQFLARLVALHFTPVSE